MWIYHELKLGSLGAFLLNPVHSKGRFGKNVKLRSINSKHKIIRSTMTWDIQANLSHQQKWILEAKWKFSIFHKRHNLAKIFYEPLALIRNNYKRPQRRSGQLKEGNPRREDHWCQAEDTEIVLICLWLWWTPWPKSTWGGKSLFGHTHLMDVHHWGTFE